MKKLFTDKSMSRCEIVKGILESSGIPCYIKNEFVVLSAGQGPLGPLPFFWPELWVLDDDQYQEAKEILEAYEEPEPSC